MYLPTFRPVCNLGLSGRQFASWSSPFTRKFLPGQCFSCSGLLFLSNLLRISLKQSSGVTAHRCSQARTPHRRRTSQVATSTSVLQSERPHIIPGANVYTAWKRVCYTQRCRQVNIGYLRERLLVSLEIINPRSHSCLKTAWIWLGKVPGVKWPATGVAPVAAATFRTAHWPVFLEDVTLTSGSCQWQPQNEPPAETTPTFSSDLWCRRHHFPYCR